MKIKNHIKYEWWFRPHENSKLQNKLKPYKRIFVFRYKSDLMKFLNNNFEDVLNGEVSISYQTFNSFATLREYFVWYNDYADINEPSKIVLKQLDFRGRKYISPIDKISKLSKKYFSMSSKRMSLMWYIGKNGINKSHAKNLLNIFYKSGFKDFIINKENQKYVDYYLVDGNEIPWLYWSDRCDYLRMKIIIEWFKQNNLI